MEPTATAGPDPSAAPLPEVSALLDGVPRQRGGPDRPGTLAPAPLTRALCRARRLLPTPAGTPFTFGYAAVLALTSLFGAYADPSLVHSLHQASSTDVAHLLESPALVLLASALWVAGGLVSPYVVCFLLVLTALERRTGGARAAVVFLAGHVLATLVTEGTVGLAVLVGHLPDSSLHRLDYGISFGVAAAVGALAGLLGPWLRLPLLVLFGGMLVRSLIGFTDPMTGWGHLIALATGVATWPLVRRWYRETRAARLPKPRPGG
ncbi:rhomboid-like protein [Streptomyces sp. NPDC101225]|uniref:rhomboid-like protein n=1 Tax=Streptomyces sp. NPDC101225 TaxID=3366135 RepID=UPI0037FEC18D